MLLHSTPFKILSKFNLDIAEKRCVIESDYNLKKRKHGIAEQ